MKKLVLITLFLFNLINLANAQYANILVNNLTIQYGKQTPISASSKQVMLKNNSSKEEIELYNGPDLIIMASYKLSTNDGVRRSNLKKSAVNVIVNYKFIYKGKKNKVKTERIFYLDDERKFEEEQTAVFKEGINNKLITIKYICTLN